MNQLTSYNSQNLKCYDTNYRDGGDALSLFETRPLEDILADIADGWDSTQQSLERLKVKPPQETMYVL